MLFEQNQIFDKNAKTALYKKLNKPLNKTREEIAPPSINKTLVIIGNADVTIDHSEFINNADCVIRFNRCRNYNINTGTKTDILVLNNTGKSAKKSVVEQYYLNQDYTQDLKEIWFSAPTPSKKKQLLNKLTLNNTNTDYSADIISNNQLTNIKNIECISNSFYQACLKYLLRFNNKDNQLTHKPKGPSSGSLCLELTLLMEQFQDHDIYCTGFGFKGWKRHPWKFEEQNFNQRIKTNRIKSL